MNTLTKRLFWMAVCCLPFISSGCKQSETAVKESSISDALYQNLPFEMPKVQQPVFPAYEVNIEKFGAKGDGLFLNTKAINDAIKEVNQRGGGKVIIPEGIWLTGPIELLSNVNLYTEQNALVLFTGDFEAYPIIATSFEGLETRRCQSPISARNAENIAITGHGTFLLLTILNSTGRNHGRISAHSSSVLIPSGTLKSLQAIAPFNEPAVGYHTSCFSSRTPPDFTSFFH